MIKIIRNIFSKKRIDEGGNYYLNTPCFLYSVTMVHAGKAFDGRYKIKEPALPVPALYNDKLNLSYFNTPSAFCTKSSVWFITS